MLDMMRGQNKAAERDYYNRYGAEFEEAFPDALYERWFRLSRLWDAAPMHILEAACGAGYFGHRLAGRGHRIMGVDLSPTMVARANADSPPGFRAIVGDLEDPSLFPAAQFDAVLFGQALHHFPHRERVLANCDRWLRPGGRLILIEPNGSNPINRVGKWVGRLLAIHPAMRKAIGTVNEVSLPVGGTIRALRRQGFLLETEQMEAEFPGGDAHAQSLPWLLRALNRCRHIFYRVCWRWLPPRWGGIQFILGARKPIPAEGP